MDHYLLEFSILLTTAFFIGALLGCLSRKVIGAAAPKSDTKNAEQAALTAAAAAAVATAATEIESDEPSEEDASPDVISTAHGYVAMAALAATLPKVVFSKREEPAKTAEITPSIHPTVDLQSTPPPRFAAVAHEKKDSADNLQLIRGIDNGIGGRLLDMGISRYSQIVQWTTEDVARINGELGFTSRIERENWIEQAKILADGGETIYSKRVKGGETPTLEEEDIKDRDDEEPDDDDGGSGPSGPGPSNAGGVDIGKSIYKAMQENKASPLPQNIVAAIASAGTIGLAATMAGERRKSGQLAQDNFKSIVKGVEELTGPDRLYAAETRFSLLLADKPVPGKRRLIHSWSPSGDHQYLLDDFDFEEPGYGRPIKRSKIIRQSRSSAQEHDDLKKIKSIGAVLEKRLNAIGISTFSQIANLSLDELSELRQKINLPGSRIDDSLIDEAQTLHEAQLQER